MQKQTINQKDPEKEFILCKNVSGTTLSAGAAVYFDTASATDGFAVSGARTSQKFMFAGIVDKAIDSGKTGLVQTYGIASAYVQWSGALTAGAQLDAVTSQTYLTTFTPVSATSLVPTVDNPWNFVSIMSGAASGISTATLEVVFVRAR
jgi:hypothetical protein